MADSTKHTSRLNGRKVLIFGGSSGLGYGAAEACIENGMTVIITSSSEERVDGAIKRILESYPSAGRRISGYACDLGNQSELEQNILNLFAKVGVVDHIIHSAGDSLPSVSVPLDKIDIDSAVKAHMVRYFAPMMIGKHAKQYLSAGPYSSITLTSGTITLRPIRNWVLANGIMGALQSLAQALAFELAPIRVNVVQPGAVASELWSHMNKEELAEMQDNIEKNVLTQRFAQPEDLAETYLYTLKDPNLTGAMIRSDSGAMLK